MENIIEFYCLHGLKMSSGVCSFRTAAECDNNVIRYLKDCDKTTL